MRDEYDFHKEITKGITDIMQSVYDGTVLGVFNVIDEQIIKHQNAVKDYLEEDDFDMANAHAGACTGLIMLKKRLNEINNRCDED
jgi:hypothetical protein